MRRHYKKYSKSKRERGVRPKASALLLGLFIGIVLGIFIFKYETKRIFLSPVSDPIATVDVRETFEQRRARQISAYLQRYNSPLLPYASEVVTAGISYGIDPVLIVSLSKRESSLCKNANFHNCWGLGGTHNYMRFSSYNESIWYVAKLLGTSPYYEDFRKSHDYIDLARRYCADVKASEYANFLKEVEESIEKI